jgi:hypothetical protein
MACRLPSGIEKLYAAITPSIESNHPEALQQRIVCLQLAELIPEECDSLDLSRTLRVEVNEALRRYSVKLLTLLETWLVQNVASVELVFHSLLTLTSYIPKCFQLSDLYDKHVLIIERSWDLVNDYGSSAKPALDFFVKLFVSKESDRTDSRDRAVYYLYDQIRRSYDYDRRHYGKLVEPSSDDLVFATALVEMVEAEVVYTASHQDLAVPIFQVILGWFGSSRKYSLSTIDLWLAAGDIPMSNRQPYLQREAMQHVLYSSIVLSSHLISDSDVEVEEYRDEDVGIVDVLKLCYDGLGSELYIAVLASYYQEHLSKSSDQNRVLLVHEVVMYHLTQIIDYEEDLSTLCSNQTLYAIMIQLLHISSHSVKSPSVDIVIPTALQLMGKAGRLSSVTGNNAELQSQQVLCLETLLLSINSSMKSYNIKIACKSLKAILMNWCPAYLKSITVSDALDILIYTLQSILSYMQTNILEEDSGGSSYDLLWSYLNLIKSMDPLTHGLLIEEVLNNLLSSLESSVAMLTVALESRAHLTNDHLKHTICAMLVLRLIVKVYGDFQDDLKTHTRISLLLASLCKLALSSSILAYNEHLYDEFSHLIVELSLWQSFLQIMNMEDIVAFALSKLKSKSLVDLLASFRCLSSISTCQMSNTNLIWKIYHSMVMVVSETFVDPRIELTSSSSVNHQGSLHILDDSVESIDSLYDFLSFILSQYLVDPLLSSSLSPAQASPCLSLDQVADILLRVFIISSAILSYYSDESLSRQVLRSLKLIFSPPSASNDGPGIFMLVINHINIEHIDTMVSIIYYYCILASSSSLRRSLAIDVLVNMIAYYLLMNAQDYLENFLTAFMLAPNVPFTSTIAIVPSTSFQDHHIVVAVVKYLLTLAPVAAGLTSTGSSTTLTDSTIMQYKRRTHNYLDDINKVWNHELDIEALQDHFR